ncbi:MAG TPA: DUF411 domain-containing protein [Gemmatimonadaceae bacterium]|nr:DUF411 domain-containing protein [Gemmatimonadaceae bacterium]
MKRREFVRSTLSAGAVLLIVPRALRASAAPPVMTVYKSPLCGCCGEWVKHVEGAGFTVKIVPTEDLTDVNRTAGVPQSLEACHTALVGPYVVVGHTPADLIKKMLAEKPKITGIAVPGMPQGSPGMEQGLGKQAYEVIAFERGGKTSVYAKR